jgi:integrase
LIKKITPKRAQTFYILGRAMARFEYFKQHTGKPGFSLYVPDITHKTIEDFVLYYKNEGDIAAKHPTVFADIHDKTNGVIKGNVTDYKMKLSNHTTSTTMLLYSVLGTLFDWMVKERVIDANPCRDAMIETPKQYKKEILWLTIQQRDKLADAPLKSERRQLARDIFIFACHTGLRISDIQNLTPKNIIYNYKDKYTGEVLNVLSYEPIKTSHGRDETKVYFPLSPKAMQIVEKYKGSTRNGKLFPAPKIASYDRMLQIIFFEAGLTDPVEVVNPDTGERVTRPLYELATSHLGRKTFTVNLNFATGGNISLVKKAAGHSASSRVTETTYISESVGLQNAALKRMNATTSEE